MRFANIVFVYILRNIPAFQNKSCIYKSEPFQRQAPPASSQSALLKENVLLRRRWSLRSLMGLFFTVSVTHNVSFTHPPPCLPLLPLQSRLLAVPQLSLTAVVRWKRSFWEMFFCVFSPVWLSAWWLLHLFWRIVQNAGLAETAQYGKQWISPAPKNVGKWRGEPPAAAETELVYSASRRGGGEKRYIDWNMKTLT